MSLRKHLEHFAQNTSMHGFGRVILTKKPEKRVAWVIVFLSAWALFAFQLTSVLATYFKYSKKTTIEFAAGGAPFPAITLCNMQSLDFYVIDKFLKRNESLRSNSNDSLKETLGRDNSFAYHSKLLEEVLYRYWLLERAQSSDFSDLNDMFSRTNFIANLPTEASNEIAIKQHEFVVKCKYGNSTCLFTEIPDPYYLRCFTFEPPQTRKTSFKNFKSLSEGVANGFSVIAFTGTKSIEDDIQEKLLPGVYENGSALSGSSGIRVVIHPPGTEPFPLTEGYDVPPGYQASIGIVPERRKRLGKPYGLCARKNRYQKNYIDEIRGSDTEEQEPYRKISCERMCMQQKVINDCKCFDDTLPDMGNVDCNNENSCWLAKKKNRKGNDTGRGKIQTCRSIVSFEECALDDKCNVSIVADTLENIRCADNIIETLMTDLKSLSKCKCYAPCDEFRYQVSYSLAKWPSSGYEGRSVYADIFKNGNFIDRFTGDKREMYSNYVSRSGMQSLNDFAKVNVYITDSNVMQIIEEPATTITQLISEIGGQLGIWIGVSVITISEVLETIMKIATVGLKKLYRKFQPRTKDEDDKTQIESDLN